MPNYSESVVPSARGAIDASNAGGTAQKTLECVVSRAIVLACDSSAYTCTASVNGATSENLQYILELLHTHGYQTSISGTTLTVTWGS